MKESFDARFNSRRELQPEHFDKNGARRTLRKMPGSGNYVLLSDAEFAEEMGQQDRTSVKESWPREVKAPSELNINGDLGSHIQSHNISNTEDKLNKDTDN